MARDNGTESPNHAMYTYARASMATFGGFPRIGAFICRKSFYTLKLSDRSDDIGDIYEAFLETHCFTRDKVTKLAEDVKP